MPEANTQHLAGVFAEICVCFGSSEADEFNTEGYGFQTGRARIRMLPPETQTALLQHVHKHHAQWYHRFLIAWRE